MLVILLLVCVSSAWCAPQSRRQPNPVQPSAPIPSVSSPIPILNHYENVNGDGSFNFSYETGNGIHVQEGGYIKKLPLPQGHSASFNSDEVDADGGGISVQVITGSYSYKTPNGTEISLTYIADENGFQPQGAHLPTPPPIPPEILKSLQLQPKSEEHSDNYQDKSIQESASNTDEIQDYSNPSNFDILRRKRR